MIRAFLAADVDDGLLDGAEVLTAALARSLRARWVKRGLMHCTVRFFGEIDDAVVTALVTVVPRLTPGRAAVPRVRATRIDAFPDLRRARVLVLPLEDDGTLSAIHEEIEAHAVELGLERGRRGYHPHLTLARFREPTDIRRAIAGAAPSLEGIIRSLTLYASTLDREGPRYEALARRSFDRA